MVSTCNKVMLGTHIFLSVLVLVFSALAISSGVTWFMALLAGILSIISAILMTAATFKPDATPGQAPATFSTVVMQTAPPTQVPVQADIVGAAKFDPQTGQPIPKFDPQTGKQNW